MMTSSVFETSWIFKIDRGAGTIALIFLCHTIIIRNFDHIDIILYANLDTKQDSCSP